MIKTTNFTPEPFDEWFAKLPLNEAVMSLIFQLYQYDQLGKANEETLMARVVVSRQLPKASIDDQINKLSEALRYGVLDDVFRLARNKKENQ